MMPHQHSTISMPMPLRPTSAAVSFDDPHTTLFVSNDSSSSSSSSLPTPSSSNLPAQSPSPLLSSLATAAALQTYDNQRHTDFQSALQREFAREQRRSTQSNSTKSHSDHAFERDLEDLLDAHFQLAATRPPPTTRLETQRGDFAAALKREEERERRKLSAPPALDEQRGDLAAALRREEERERERRRLEHEREQERLALTRPALVEQRGDLAAAIRREEERERERERERRRLEHEREQERLALTRPALVEQRGDLAAALRREEERERERERQRKLAQETTPFTRLDTQRHGDLEAAIRREQERERERERERLRTSEPPELLQSSDDDQDRPRPQSQSQSHSRLPHQTHRRSSSASTSRHLDSQRHTDFSSALARETERERKREEERLETERKKERERELIGRRWFALLELVDTEVVYEQDLRILCEIYLRELASAPWITPDDVDSIARNAHDLRSFHESFVVELQTLLHPFLSAFASSTPSSSASSSSSPSPPSTPSTVPDVQKTVLTALALISKHFTRASRLQNGNLSRLYEVFCKGHMNALDVVRRVEKEANGAILDGADIGLGLPSAMIRSASASGSVRSSASRTGSVRSKELVDIEKELVVVDLPKVGLWEAFERKCAEAVLEYEKEWQKGMNPDLVVPSSPQQLATPPVSPPLTTAANFPSSPTSTTTTPGTTSLRRKLTFRDYLIKPIQRICKYPLLLSALESRIAPSNPSTTTPPSSTTQTPLITNSISTIPLPQPSSPSARSSSSLRRRPRLVSGVLPKRGTIPLWDDGYHSNPDIEVAGAVDPDVSLETDVDPNADWSCLVDDGHALGLDCGRDDVDVLDAIVDEGETDAEGPPTPAAVVVPPPTGVAFPSTLEDDLATSPISLNISLNFENTEETLETLDKTIQSAVNAMKDVALAVDLRSNSFSNSSISTSTSNGSAGSAAASWARENALVLRRWSTRRISSSKVKPPPMRSNSSGPVGPLSSSVSAASDPATVTATTNRAPGTPGGRTTRTLSMFGRRTKSQTHIPALMVWSPSSPPPPLPTLPPQHRNYTDPTSGSPSGSTPSSPTRMRMGRPRTNTTSTEGSVRLPPPLMLVSSGEGGDGDVEGGLVRSDSFGGGVSDDSGCAIVNPIEQPVAGAGEVTVKEWRKRRKMQVTIGAPEDEDDYYNVNGREGGEEFRPRRPSFSGSIRGLFGGLLSPTSTGFMSPLPQSPVESPQPSPSASSPVFENSNNAPGSDNGSSAPTANDVVQLSVFAWGSGYTNAPPPSPTSASAAKNLFKKTLSVPSALSTLTGPSTSSSSLSTRGKKQRGISSSTYFSLSRTQLGSSSELDVRTGEAEDGSDGRSSSRLSMRSPITGPSSTSISTPDMADAQNVELDMTTKKLGKRSRPRLFPSLTFTPTTAS